MKICLLLLIHFLLAPSITTEDEILSCAVYGSINVCFNATHIQISKSTGALKKSYFPTMSSIQSMEFVSNNLTDIEPKFFSKFPELTELIIRGNEKFPNITRHLLGHCQKLISLKIYFNMRLHHIDENVLRNFPNLKELIIRSERIQHLRKHDLQVVTNLRVLNLDLTTLKRIDNNAFEPIGKLEELSLMANNFLHINNEIFHWIPNLTELNLIYAEVNDISFLKKLPKLRILKLAGNKISNLFADDVKGLSELRELDLAHTRIKHIDTSASFYKNVPKLKKIDITCHDLGSELFDIVNLSEHGITLIDKYTDIETRTLSC
ncbi:leucine-rich repeat-containing protein 4B-like [Coccinella septempunctata]|uniref:leucine-rich repeat-containing protein 4B-like n=1 Tax=Coccinella septempunctata TaxID=41139 RepID=UPI001D08D0F5|nr:leucine-rich repeat-containing protein 4B-like [Coccinella septempunctata]